MTARPGDFLRATYYRWATLFPIHCTEAARAPTVLALGDVHIENFGTWQDAEGRLVFGANDFDEVARLPWTNDLIRLATSARVARATGDLRLRNADIAAVILEGYRESLELGGEPQLLDERRLDLRRIATHRLADPADFWARATRFRIDRAQVPPDARRAIEAVFPKPRTQLQWFRRVSGVGSLGRPRVLAIGRWRGGRAAREAKAIIPSPAASHGSRTAQAKAITELLRIAVRSPDPFISIKGTWVVRRLTPDTSRIRLADLPSDRDDGTLLKAMGFELANFHLGSRTAGALKSDLKKLESKWLLRASSAMHDQVLADWEEWRA